MSSQRGTTVGLGGGNNGVRASSNTEAQCQSQGYHPAQLQGATFTQRSTLMLPPRIV